jgi:Protein of unknown function (DUF3303)
MLKTLYMIVERFKDNDALPVYRRFRDQGRMAPDGLTYVSSWIDDKLQRCYQLMETNDRRLLERWMSHWNDLVEFEVYPVMTSKEAAEKIAPRL